jgi:hypothetical protein
MTTIQSAAPTHVTYALSPTDATHRSPSRRCEVTAPLAGGRAGAAVWGARVVRAGVAGDTR